MDHILGHDVGGPTFDNKKTVYPAKASPLVNNEQGFIPVMTNSCLSVSGWPDVEVPIFTSEPGKNKEVYMQVDGKAKVVGPKPLTCTFANSAGEPIVVLLSLWAKYTGLVFSGKMFPYMDMVSENEIDYNIRVFRLIFDHTGRYVTRIGATIPGFLGLAGLGAPFDFDVTRPSAGNADEITWPMTFPSVEFDDPILMKDFNDIVSTFKVHMDDEFRYKNMVKVPFRFKKYFKTVSYPWINPQTLEFESWVDIPTWFTIQAHYNKSGLLREEISIEEHSS